MKLILFFSTSLALGVSFVGCPLDEDAQTAQTDHIRTKINENDPVPKPSTDQIDPVVNRAFEDAIINNDLNAALVSIEKGANVKVNDWETQSLESLSPLGYVLKNTKSPEMLSFLLENGANATAEEPGLNLQNPAQYALLKEACWAIPHFIEHGFDYDKYNHMLIYLTDYCLKDSLEDASSLKRWLKAGIKSDRALGLDKMPLIYHVVHTNIGKNQDAIASLLTPNLQLAFEVDGGKESILHWLVKNQDLRSFEATLAHFNKEGELDNKMDELKDKEGKTPLHLAYPFDATKDGKKLIELLEKAIPSMKNVKDAADKLPAEYTAEITASSVGTTALNTAVTAANWWGYGKTLFSVASTVVKVAQKVGIIPGGL